MNFEQIKIPLLLTFLAGISTGIGSLIAFLIKDFKKVYLNFFLGLSAGVMVYVSFAELLAKSIEKIGFAKANIAFFLGMGFILAIDFIIPHEYIEEHVTAEASNKKLMTAGVFTAIGIAIHNLPEGLAVFISAIENVNLGIPLAFAIAIHNIPEGIAVAMPIYFATKSRKKALWYSFLSGIVEPVGAILGILFLMPILTQTVLSFFSAFVAGIMVFISFDELLPLSYQGEHEHVSILGLILGMIIMALSLYLL